MHTDILVQTAIVLEIQVGQRAVDVRAHLLSRLSRSERPDHGDLRRALPLRRPCTASQHRVEICGGRLVVVDAVQTEAERLHDATAVSRCM